MKLCSVVLFAVLALASADHGTEKGKKVKEMYRKCMVENKVDMKTLKSNLDKDDPETKVKCVFACVCQATNIMNADGSPNQAGADAMIADMPEKLQEDAKKDMNECMKLMKAGLPECESGYKYTVCRAEKMVNRNPFANVVKQCMNESGVDMETLKSNRDKADPPTNVKCVSHCLYTKVNIMNADGSPNQAGADALIAKVPEKVQELVKNMMSDCMKLMKAGLPECESGYKYGECMKKKMSHHEGKTAKEAKKEG